jgi:MFS family permease
MMPTQHDDITGFVLALPLLLLMQLVGPIPGPILGGALSQAFSWRSTFIAIAMYAGVIILPLLAFLPETHHYRKLQKLQKADPAAAATVQEREFIFETPPVFKAPYYPLQVIHQELYCDAPTALYAHVTCFCSNSDSSCSRLLLKKLV